MRPTIRFVLLLTLAAAVGGVAPTLADYEIRTIEREFSIDEQVVVLDVPLGDLFIIAGESGRVGIEVVVTCGSRSRRCRERAEEIFLEDRQRRRSLSLEIDGYSNKLTSRPHIDIYLTMPAGNGLEVDMGVGDVEVDGLDGAVEIDLGVGDVIVSSPESRLGSLRLSVGVGTTNVSPRLSRQSTSGFLVFGNEVYWDEGKGRGDYAIDVGVGEIAVVLDD